MEMSRPWIDALADDCGSRGTNTGTTATHRPFACCNDRNGRYHELHTLQAQASNLWEATLAIQPDRACRRTSTLCRSTSKFPCLVFPTLACSACFSAHLLTWGGSRATSVLGGSDWILQAQSPRWEEVVGVMTETDSIWVKNNNSRGK